MYGLQTCSNIEASGTPQVPATTYLLLKEEVLSQPL